MANRAAELLVKYLRVPRAVAEKMGRAAVLEGLQVTYDLTKDYTPQHYFDEIRGFATGAHISEHDITLVNMVYLWLCTEAFTSICSIGCGSRQAGPRTLQV